MWEEYIRSIPEETPEDAVWRWCNELWIIVEDLMPFWWQSYWKDWELVMNPYYDSGVWNDFLFHRKDVTGDSLDSWGYLIQEKDTILNILTLPNNAKNRVANSALCNLEKCFADLDEWVLFDKIEESVKINNNWYNVKMIVDWMKSLRKKNPLLYVKLYRFICQQLNWNNDFFKWVEEFVNMITQSIEDLHGISWAIRKIKWKNKYWYKWPDSCFSYVQSFIAYSMNQNRLDKNNNPTWWQHYAWMDIHNN